MKKVIYFNEYESRVFYGYEPEHRVKSYIKVTMHFDFKDWLRFSIEVPNISWCYRNPIKGILRVLEHESIGMSKYNKLKEDIRSKGLDKNLDFS